MGITRRDFSPTVEPIEKGLSTNRPANPTEGRTRYETDTDEIVVYDGGLASWEVVYPAAGGPGGGAPDTVDYLVGTADAGLSAEIVVGTTPGGELGGTWASPTVDATHSGSTHAATQAAAEATASTALGVHAAAADPHTGYQKESEKDTNNGYAGLDAGGLVPDARIASTITRDSELDARLSAANATDLTDGGGTTLHTHVSTGISDFAEAVSDQVGTMVTGNTETGITVTYQDSDNTVDYELDTAYLDARFQNNSVSGATTRTVATGQSMVRAKCMKVADTSILQIVGTAILQVR